MTTIPQDLTAEQRDGHACVVCERSFLIGAVPPHMPVGVVDGGQVFACSEPCAEFNIGLDAQTEQPSSLPTPADLDAIARVGKPDPREILRQAVSAVFKLTAGQCSADRAAVAVRAWARHIDADPDDVAQNLAAAVDKARKHPHRGGADAPIDVRFACWLAQKPAPGQVFADSEGSRYWVIEHKGLRIVDVRGVQQSARTLSGRRGVLLRVWES